MAAAAARLGGVGLVDDADLHPGVLPRLGQQELLEGVVDEVIVACLKPKAERITDWDTLMGYLCH